jgi:L-ascorbate metabolism protein UlaG (beta-lactamase superfamily)
MRVLPSPGWLIQRKTKSVYCSGDTGYADHFKAIGKAYGPFDLTIIKVGAYSKKWPKIKNGGHTFSKGT